MEIKQRKFKNLWLKSEQGISEELITLSRERFWNYQEVKINETEENILEVMLVVLWIILIRIRKNYFKNKDMT